MNIGEASNVLTLITHLTTRAAPEDYPDDVVLAVADLNSRARRTLGAGPILPAIWLTSRDQILAARTTSRRGTASPNSTSGCQ